MVLPYLKGFSLYFCVVHGECFGIFVVQGFISEVKGYILSLNFYYNIHQCMPRGETCLSPLLLVHVWIIFPPPMGKNW
jgi:hypothetical protein